MIGQICQINVKLIKEENLFIGNLLKKFEVITVIKQAMCQVLHITNQIMKQKQDLIVLIGFPLFHTNSIIIIITMQLQ